MSTSICVVVPARDASATLGRTLASVAWQSRPADEVVVVDDGSRDDTGAVAEQAGAVVVGTPGEGVAAARNRGIATASADVVAFLDADDAWHPDHLAAVERAIERADVVAARVVEVAPDGRFISHRPAPPSTVPAFDLLLGVPILTSATAVRRASLVALGGFDPALAASEDTDLWLRLLLSGARLAPAPSMIAYTVRTARESREKLERVVHDQGLVYRRAAALLDLDATDRARAERALRLTWARRYEANGYRQEARWHAAAARPDARASAFGAFAALPWTSRRAFKQSVRVARRLAAPADARRFAASLAEV